MGINEGSKMEVLNSVKTKLNNTVELIGEEGENNILIIGVFHGDEPQGKYLIEEYLNKLAKLNVLNKHFSKNKKNNLLFIPCLNPDGMANNTRTNANGTDLNRNFPTKNWGQNEGENADCNNEKSNYYGGKSPASEIETKFLIDTIEKYTPKLILTIHTPYKTVNYDGPAEKAAQMISDIIKYPVEKSIGYPTPGSFGTYCGVERNIPTITLEIDEVCDWHNLISPIFEIFDELSYL